MGRLIAVVLLGLLAGCVSTTRFRAAADRPSASVPPSASKEVQEDALRRAADEWLNVPYRFGGESRQGIDCSGLTCRIYREVYGIELPRTVEQQIQAGRFVQKARLQPGDLLFFRTGGSGAVDHVGIYLGQGRFVHASLQRGVVISELEARYYQRRYVTARRILP